MKKENQPKQRKRWKKVLLIILCIVLVLLLAGFLILRSIFMQPSIPAATGDDRTIVETANGKIRGSLTDSVYQYLGIPYAEAKERFTPAAPVQPWSGVLDANAVGAMSPQSGMLGMSAGNQDGTDNNCQNLNIWTPGIMDGQKRAVMVWLHGGGFSTGSANQELYSGKDLSASGDVVVVSVNHRLGVAGFLDLSAYGEKYRYSGNAGLTDLVQALEWIHENIAAFGGDPENVTLFGQSGGGAKVLAQLNIQPDDIEALQTLDWQTLESASQQALRRTAEKYQIPAPLSSGYAMEWGPVVEGDYLPTNPVTADSFAENGKDVALLIGSNLNEWTMMMGGNQGKLSEEAVQAFQAAYPTKEASRANRVDTLIRLPMLKIMSHKADQLGAPVYAYVFTWNPGLRGAYHGAEIPFVFHHAQRSQAAQQLADRMSQAWVNFAKTGVPSAEGLPEWEPYTRDSGATMLLDETPALVHHHDEKLMQLLAPEYVY